MPLPLSLQVECCTSQSWRAVPMARGTACQSARITHKEIEKHNITKKTVKRGSVCYISDIHIENQLDLVGKTAAEVEEVLRLRICKLSKTIDETAELIVFAGDISSSLELTKRFLRLFASWRPVLFIPGNHELFIPRLITNIVQLTQKLSSLQLSMFLKTKLKRMLLCCRTNSSSVIRGKRILSFPRVRYWNQLLTNSSIYSTNVRQSFLAGLGIPETILIALDAS